MLSATAACGGSAAKGSDASPSASSSVAAGVGASQKIQGLTVSGPVGKEPTVKLSTPFTVKRAETQVLTVGTGVPVREGKDALLHIYLADGATGKKAAATYDQGMPAKLTMSNTQLFPQLIKALVGKPSGSRIAVADKVTDMYGAKGNPQIGLKPKDSVVFVIDVISAEPVKVLSGPEGTKKALPAGLPTVVEKAGKVTNLDFSHAAPKPSGKLQVVPIVEGHGPVVRDPSLVTFNYLGEVYGGKKPFDESYSKQPVPFAVGIHQLVKAWDQGLIGLRQGSRVMIIAPPTYGYGAAGNPQGGIKGNATLVFVVDILGVG
jgi:peptidylprolyl isomerase